MEFKERKIDANGKVIEEGTLINKELLEKANWREDDLLSFKIRTGAIPQSEIDSTQIYTTTEGKTYIVPPGENRNPVEIGKVVGTTVKIGEQETDTLNFESHPQTQIEELKLRADNLESDAYMKSKILNYAYPIGSIYMSVANASPASFLGGSWLAWGAGRVPLSIGNNGETNYTAPEQTGGSENSVAVHNHTQDSHSHTQSTHLHGVPEHYHTAGSQDSYATNANGLFRSGSMKGFAGTATTGGTMQWRDRDVSGNILIKGGSCTTGGAAPAINGNTAINNATGIAGGNRMPFITCYMWKRIS